MPHRVPWDTDFAVGHALIDQQHQQLLALCNQLADHCDSTDAGPAMQRFDQDCARLMALARAHFQTEAALLAERGVPGLEDHSLECDEFEYLAGEIATTEHFDRLELQRFLALWWLGHLRGSAPAMRAWLGGP